MSSQQPSRPSYTDFGVGTPSSPAEANPPDSPVKSKASNGRLPALILLVVGMIATIALFVSLFALHRQAQLLLAMGTVSAVLLFGLFLWLVIADNGMNQRFSRVLASTRPLANAMQNLSNDLQFLRQDLDKNRQLAQAVHDAVTRPEFSATPSQMASIERAVSLLQAQLDRMDQKMGNPPMARTAPIVTKPEFAPSAGASAAQRLEQAVGYYEQRLSSAARPARANLNALKQAAQDSLAFEKRLRNEAESLFNPDDLWLWDIMDKDIFANPALPVGLQEIPEDEAKILALLSEELIRYRRALVEILDRQFGVKRIETLPHETKFDTALHQTDERSKIKTVAADLHLLIAGVQSAGFTRNGQTIRKPKVSYYVYSSETPAAAVPAAAPPVAAQRLPETETVETPAPLTDTRGKGINI